MKTKKTKVLIGLLLIISMVLCGSGYPDQTVIYYCTFLHNQGQSNVYYANLCKAFEKEYGENSFPDYYGGSRLNSEGVLSVQLTNDTESIRQEIFLFAETKELLFEKVEFSYNELLRTYEEIHDYCQSSIDKGNLDIPFCDACVDENRNRIVVRLLKDETFKNELISELSYPQLCVFEEAKERCHGDASVYSGGQLSLAGGYYSAGFRCKCTYNGQVRNCLITAAHGNAVGDEVKKGNQYGPTIGYLRFRQFSGTVDASVIVLDSGYDVPIFTIYNTTLATTIYTTAVATNSIVWKEGAFGSKAQGTVTSNNSMCLYEWHLITNMICSIYHAVSGDSGGIVYTYVGSSNCIVGIHCANDELIGARYSCQAKNIISALGLTLY